MSGSNRRKDEEHSVIVPAVAGGVVGAGTYSVVGGAGLAVVGTGVAVGLGGFILAGALAGIALDALFGD